MGFMFVCIVTVVKLIHLCRISTKYALLSELLHDPLCNIPTYYNLSKIDLLSLRLSSTGCSLVISATRTTSVLDYSSAAISFIIYYLLYLVRNI